MSDSADKPEIQPVIFASNRLQRLWPSSTPKLSYTFVPDASGLSPFERLCMLIAQRPGYREPIVFATPSSAIEARRQCRSGFATPPLIMAVDDDTSLGTLSVLAAIQAARRNNRSRCLFLPGTFCGPHDDVADVLDALAAGDPSRPDAAGFLAGPATTSASLVFELFNTPSLAGWHPVRTAQRRAELDADGDVPPHHFSLIGPSSVRAKDLLEMVHRETPVILQACQNALSTATTRKAGIMRPGQSFLSLAGSFDLAELMARHSNRILILPASPRLSVVTHWDDPNAREPAVVHGAVAQAQRVGFDGGRIINGPGGTLLLEHGKALEVGFPRAVATHERGAGDTIMASNVHEKVDSHDLSDLWRIVVAPKQSLGPECHFRRMEQWLVAAGTGVAVVNGEHHDLEPGSIVTIPVAANHALNNPSSQPLVIYELRIGMLRDGDDTLRLGELGAAS